MDKSSVNIQTYNVNISTYPPTGSLKKLTYDEYSLLQL